MEGIQHNGGIVEELKKRKQIFFYFLLGEGLHSPLLDLQFIHGLKIPYHAHGNPIQATCPEVGVDPQDKQGIITGVI